MLFSVMEKTDSHIHGWLGLQAGPIFNNSTSCNLSLGKTGSVLNSTPPEEWSHQSLREKYAVNVMRNTTEKYPFYIK